MVIEMLQLESKIAVICLLLAASCFSIIYTVYTMIPKSEKQSQKGR